MSAAYDIAQHLASLGHGTLGTTLFVGTEPPLPNDCMTVYDTGGSISESMFQMYEQTIQIRSRSVLYLNGYDILSEARDALILPTSFEFGGWHYTGIWLVSDIAKIGRDERNREILTANFRLMREPINSST